MPSAAVHSPQLPEIVRVLADGAADAVMIVDLATRRHLYFNDAAVRLLRPMTRAQVEELGADGVLRCFGPSGDGPDLDDLLARTPQQVSTEATLGDGQGGQRAVRIARRTLRVDGRWLAVLDVRELTDPRHQQERIERLLSGLDLSDDGIFLIDRATMRYLDVSEGACRLLGYSRAELMRRWPNQTSRTLGDLEQLAAAYDEVIANAPATQVLELPIERADGATIICEVRRKPVLQSGRWIIAATLRDVTESKRAQARMTRFATAMALSGDAVFMIDRQSMKYVDVNEAACKLLGYTREELLQRKPNEAGLRRYRKNELAKLYDEVIAAAPQTMAQEEVELVRADGSLVTCDVRRQAIRSESGWMIVATCRDVTERKAARARTELLASAMNASSDLVFLIDRERMAYVDANEATLRLFRMGRDEFLRARPWEISRFPHTREQMMEEFDRLIATAPEPDKMLRLVRDAQGGIAEAYDVRRQALQIGGRWVILVSARDVSDRLREQARAELFASVLNLSAEQVCVADRATMTFVDANPAACALFGLPREEFVGLKVATFAHRFGFDITKLEAGFDKLIAKAPAADERQTHYRRADGSSGILQMRRQAMHIGERWLIVVTARDVTDRNAAQSRAQLLATAVNSSSDRTYFIDRERMEFIDGNGAALKHHGVAMVEELRRIRPWVGVRATLDPEQLAATYDLAIAQTPQPLRQTEVWHEPDGTVAGAAEVVRTAVRIDGRWVIISTWHDMSEHMRQRDRMERLATALELSADAVFLIDRQSMRFIDVNQSACTMLGMTREALMVRPPNLDSPNLGTLGDLAKIYDRTIAKSPDVQAAEMALRRIDGTLVPVEMRAQAIRSAGRWIIVATARDITERKKALARTQLFASSLNISADGIFFIDRATVRYVDVNDTVCRMFRLSREELLAREPGTFVTRPVEEILAIYDELIANAPQTQTEECDFRRDDGSVIQAEVTRQAIQTDGRWIISVTVRDIADRKAAQARNALLATAMNSSSDHIVILDPEAVRFVDGNEAALKFHGLTREEAQALPAWIPIPGFTVDQMRAAYMRAIEQRPGIDRSVYLAHGIASGRTGIFEVRRQAIRIGERWLVLATGTDVTERQEHLAHIERLAAAMELGADGVVLVDAESNEVLYANEAAATLLGAPRQELVGSKRGAFAVPGPTFQEIIRQSPATLATEMTVHTADGRSLPCEVRRQAIRSGERWIVVSTLRDISERKKAQARNELLAAAMNSSSDYIVIIDPQTRTVVDGNEAALRFHGLQRSELLGMPSWFATPQFSAEDMSRRYQEVIELWPESHRSVHSLTGLRTGKTGVFDVRRQALRADGRWLIVATSQDVTERQEHLARIERLAAAMELSEDAVTMVEGETRRLLFANEATSRLLGASRDELAARGEALAQLGPALDEVIRRSPATLVEEVAMQRADGRSVPCEVRRQAILSQERWIVVSTIRDISERRRAEEEIRQKVVELTRSNQELEQFAYVTSHDLSEPLRMVASYTQLLERRYSAHFDADAREFMGYIVGGAQRMKQLIDDLLTYSRAGRPNVQLREIELERALDDALANLGHAIRVSGATIERGPLPAIVGDRSGMVQVFQNLVGNAIKFHAEDVAPVVRIVAQDLGSEWLITVADNGIGIAREYFQRIFVIFQRLHPRQKYEGTGIGLAICKKVIDRHGGRITVESQPGAGTTFHIHLPKPHRLH